MTAAPNHNAEDSEVRSGDGSEKSKECRSARGKRCGCDADSLLSLMTSISGKGSSSSAGGAGGAGGSIGASTVAGDAAVDAGGANSSNVTNSDMACSGPISSGAEYS